MIEDHQLDRYWQLIVLHVDKKEYKLRHTYSELLNLFDTSMILQSRGLKLRIDNLGVMKIAHIEFLNSINKMIIKCERG
jgi:hypothetical protein